MNTLTLDADVRNLDQVTEFVARLLEAAGCPVRPMTQLLVAVEEVFVNVARYAYGGAQGEVTIRVWVGHDVSVEFSDAGARFDPLAMPDPDIALDASERPIGGLGILLVRRTMDDVRYRYADGRNVLRITKRVAP